MTSTPASSSSGLALPPVVVMGVSGSGKSTIGAALVAALSPIIDGGTVFIDGDDLHSPANRAKMHARIPLDDTDRAPWLAAVGQVLSESPGRGPVVACSALKVAYRDALRHHAPSTVFLHLAAGGDLLLARVANRPGHFMPAELLASQLDTLEPLGAGERGVVLDTDKPVDEVVLDAVAWLRASV